MSKVAPRDRIGYERAYRLYRAAFFGEAVAVLDEILDGKSSAEFADAAILRARLYLKSDPVLALTFLTSVSGRLGTGRARVHADMLTGLAYGRLGDSRSAAGKFAEAKARAAGDSSLLNELSYLRGQVAWISRKLDVAEREIERIVPAIDGDLALEARIGLGAIAASRGDVIGQGALLLETVRLAREAVEPNVYLWAVAASQIAYLARELPGRALRDAAYDELGRIPWTADLAELHFTMVRAVAWRHALEGDTFNAFRRLKEAASLAPSPGWAVTASCDRAYFATVLGEHRWAEQERSDARELAAKIDWRSLVAEERFALLVLAELCAPHDASLALSYLARYKDAGSRFAANLASNDDRRVDAQEAHACGVVRSALGERAEGIRLFRESYAIYDSIGYDWRAGRVALALADATGDAEWSARASEKLAMYPYSWLRTRPGRRSFESDVPDEAAGPTELARLTASQRAVYERLLRGMTTSQVAEDLGRSAFTVRNHIKAIFKAFEVNSRSALLVRAIGIVPNKNRDEV